MRGSPLPLTKASRKVAFHPPGSRLKATSDAETLRDIFIHEENTTGGGSRPSKARKNNGDPRHPKSHRLDERERPLVFLARTGRRHAEAQEGCRCGCCASTSPGPSPGTRGGSRPGPASDKGTEISSPMVGTFYRAPSPDSDPFVKVGDHVDEETTVCIIEAMKVMNEIKAERKGLSSASSGKRASPSSMARRCSSSPRPRPDGRTRDTDPCSAKSWSPTAARSPCASSAPAKNSASRPSPSTPRPSRLDARPARRRGDLHRPGRQQRELPEGRPDHQRRRDRQGRRDPPRLRVPLGERAASRRSARAARSSSSGPPPR